MGPGNQMRINVENSFDEQDFRMMLLIRRFEEFILGLFSQGCIGGTTHTYIGQEANAVALLTQLDPTMDHVVSNHRCHGHFVAFGGSVDRLLAEIMGRSTGVCGGRGGSQHLKYGNFISNGILGGGVPAACGLALAKKLSGSAGIVVACIGDGTLGQGVVYESLNMASLWNLPILFLVENNRYAQTTPVKLGVAGSILQRAQPFGVEAAEIDSTDVRELRAWGSGILQLVRGERRPFWGVIHTYRFAAHSKGDDMRPVEEVARYRERDPLLIQAPRLSAAARDTSIQWVETAIHDAWERAKQSAVAKLHEVQP